MFKKMTLAGALRIIRARQRQVHVFAGAGKIEFPI
jgi:hypothetical protein